MNINTLKTFVLLAALGGLMVLIGQWYGGTGGAAIGLTLGIVMSLGSYWFSDKLAIKASRAKPVTEEQAPNLYRLMRGLTSSQSMPMPRLYVIPSDQPNAFATGRNPRKAVIAVTEGIMRLLDEEELRGVLAHELAHVRNRDILIGSVAAAVAMSITFAARMAMYGAMFGGGGGRGNNRGGHPIGLLAMAILAPLAAMIIQMTISRAREYQADKSAAKMIGYGEPLARALEKLHDSVKRVPMNVNPSAEHMFIVNPFTGRKAQFAGLFSTHPPAEERIKRLRSMLP
jgi:heat shock protein HtpX